ncbi:MoaD/ThiS family protein [Streptomyces sp. HUAS TT7]|uniref:MoaD/ThiS family protein n=1 Tax=Streptomyces sp. HUAS TT7 TaxID=3447507 RepID=UPI003F65BAFE
MTFEFSGALLRAVDNQRTLSVKANTLGEALTELKASYPQLGVILLDGSGRLRQAHRVFLNGELVTSPDRAMPLADDDQIEFLTAIAGG